MQRSFGWTYTGYATAVCVMALATLPIIDRWQDLPQLAQRIHADTAQQHLALLDPDETTIAMLDHGLDTPFTVLISGTDGVLPDEPHTPRQRVGEWLACTGAGARAGAAARPRAWRPLRAARALPPQRAARRRVAAALVAAGTAALVQRYELPQGRRYALLGPPP